MTAVNDTGHQPERVNRRRLVLYLLGTPLCFVLFLFLPAGTWAWLKGWLFLGVVLLTGALGAWCIGRLNPELYAARINPHRGTKPWDKILIGFALPAILAIFAVAALDDGRFQWFPVPWWVSGVGYVLFLMGMGIVTWAEAVNKFFEPTVRLQTERGHKVIDTGPYAVVRHPGYVGGILFCVGAALCLGSVWALIPAGLASALLILRTRWEDQTLQAELAGYKEYTERVRYKLIPGAWL
jgi:protein-S-isoprenylcysteine O-methyltransferase Ste14